MTYFRNVLWLLLVVSQCGYGQEQPAITLYPALYALSYLRAQPDSVAGSTLIGALPVLAGRFYGEVRYNYDALHTMGLYGGRVFTVGRRTWTHTLSPQLGLLWGDYRGVSAQLYYQLTTPALEVSSQQQYSVSGQADGLPFYYTWSDVQWKMGKRLRAGASVQLTYQDHQRTTDGGLLVGYQLPRLALGLYLFNLYRPGQSYAYLTAQYSIRLTRSSRPRPAPPTLPPAIPPLFSKPLP